MNLKTTVLDGEIWELVKQEAEKNQINHTAMVRRILYQYFGKESPALKIGRPVSPALIKFKAKEKELKDNIRSEAKELKANIKKIRIKAMTEEKELKAKAAKKIRYHAISDPLPPELWVDEDGILHA